MRTFFIFLAVSTTLVFSQTAQPADAPKPSAQPVKANPWKFTFNSNLTMTMNTYTDNWTGGDVGTISWAVNVNGIAEKQFTPKLYNKNTLKLAFGQAWLQDKETKDWSSPQKSTDLIDFESVLRLTFGGFVDPYIAAHLVSQFADKSDKISGHTWYVNPLDITESFGAAKDLVKNDPTILTTRLGAAARQLINRNHFDEVTAAYATEVTNDGGFEWVTDLKTANKQKWLGFVSSLKVYEAIFSSKSEEVKNTSKENDWRYPDVSWENILTLNITKYVMINFYTQLLYDRELDRDLRFKQTLSVGLTYNYASK